LKLQIHTDHSLFSFADKVYSVPDKFMPYLFRSKPRPAPISTKPKQWAQKPPSIHMPISKPAPNAKAMYPKI
jgi:hypothetical protein